MFKSCFPFSSNKGSEIKTLNNFSDDGPAEQSTMNPFFNNKNLYVSEGDGKED